MSEQIVDQKDEITIGMPKSGKPWKKKSMKNSSRIKKFHKETWDQKQKKRQEKKELKQLLDELKVEKEKKIQQERERLKEKKKRDEMNKYKSADLQIIKDTKKIKKWTKKARSQLVKLPSEMFEQLLAKNRM